MAAPKRRPRRSTKPKAGPTPTEPKPLPSGEDAGEVPQAPATPDDDARSAEDVAERDHPIG